MLYIKIQLKSFLGSGEDFKVLLLYIDMAAILFNRTEPLKQNVNTLLTEGPMCNLVKIAQAVSEKTVKNFTIFMHVYSPWARVDNPRGQNFVCTEKNYYFNHTLQISVTSL